MSSTEGTSSFRRNVLSCLTNLSHGSSVFISTFAVIHLAAPALGTIGGSSLSSQTMLLGREYYQTSFGEKYLLIGPLVVHALAGITKRLISYKSSAPPRPVSSILSVTGYATLLFFLPIHYTTHRLLPASPEPPIFAVGPAELDYEFVKLGLQKWPWTNWVLYAGLVASVSLHMVDGFNVIRRTWFLKPGHGDHPLIKLTRGHWRLLALGGMALPVLMGLYTISNEPPLIFSFMAGRFQGIFLKSGLYS